MKAASRKAYELAAERADGVCEGCGSAHAEQMHHRKFRSRGGRDDVENLFHLCHICHARAHSAHPPSGWAVSRGDDPASVPLTYRGVEKWLTDWGSAAEFGPAWKVGDSGGEQETDHRRDVSADGR